ncbi:metalloregulator ArsR/SmtB family transcription factor [Saccharopolyspora sp. NPDC050389]|uniref:ArsR/SmtB family transcription factor n=1 Tax=Saccharopolyspora sp. NPDC050389 TaxID=3155516 RepID=UPI0033C2BE39
MQSTRTDDARLVLLRHLADPVRLGVLDWLAECGPSTVSELAMHMGTSVPQLSNHLRRLRSGGLVEVERVGRQAIYRLADEQITNLLSTLGAIVGFTTNETSYAHPFMLARTCFDHLAGRLGVSLFERLMELKAVRSTGGADVGLGPEANDVFARLGIVPSDVRAGRRRFASTCPDATERRPHLGGVLAAVLAKSLEDKGWLSVRRDRREIEITAAGRQGLRTALQINVDDPSGL